jgi:hypothetical protein
MARVLSLTLRCAAFAFAFAEKSCSAGYEGDKCRPPAENDNDDHDITNMLQVSLDVSGNHSFQIDDQIKNTLLPPAAKAVVGNWRGFGQLVAIREDGPNLVLEVDPNHPQLFAIPVDPSGQKAWPMRWYVRNASSSPDPKVAVYLMELRSPSSPELLVREPLGKRVAKLARVGAEVPPWPSTERALIGNMASKACVWYIWWNPSPNSNKWDPFCLFSFGNDIADAFVEDLFGPLEPLTDCLEHLDYKFHILGFLDVIFSSTRDGLSGLGPGLYNTYVLDILTSVEEWTKTQGETDLSGATAEEIIDHSWGVFQEIAALEGLEPFHCVTQHILDPTFATLKPLIISVITFVDDAAKTAWKAITELGMGDLVTTVTQAIWDAIPPAKVGQYARGVATGRCQAKMASMRADLASFVANDYSKGPGLIDPPKLDDELVSIVVEAQAMVNEEVIGAELRKVITSVLSKMVNVVLEATNAGLTALLGFMGLVPEVGAGITALIVTPARLGATLAMPILTGLTADAILGELDKLFEYDQTKAWAEELALNMTSASSVMGTLASVFGPIGDFVKVSVEKVYGEVKAVVDECDQQLELYGKVVAMVPNATSR